MLGILFVVTLAATVFPLTLPPYGAVVLGSIAVLLVVRLYGIPWGLLAAFLAGICTLALWQPLYPALLLVVEVLVVGMLFQKGMRSILLADILFWIPFGLPLTWGFHTVFMQQGTEAVLPLLLQQGGNGLGNALIADAILRFLPLRRRQMNVPPSLWESQSNLLLACFLTPALLFVLISLKTPRDFLRTDMEAEMVSECLALRNQLLTEQKILESELKGLAPSAATLSKVLKRNPALLGVLIADNRGKTLAFSSAEELSSGEMAVPSTLMEELQSSQRSVFSTIEKSATLPLPHVNWLLPVTGSALSGGVVMGIVDVRYVQSLLEKHPRRSPFTITLLDRRARVVASSDPERQPMDDFLYEPEGAGPLAAASAYLWLPDQKSFTPLSFWEKLLSRSPGRKIAALNIPAENVLPWNVAVEIPLASHRSYLQRTIASGLAIMLVPATLALLLVWITNRRLMAPLAALRQATRDLPDKISSGRSVEWPEVTTLEVRELAENFRAMVAEVETSRQEDRRLSARSGEALDDVLAQRNWEIFTTGRKLKVEMDRRKRIEELLTELEAAESKYRFLVEKTLVGVFILTGERLSYVNPRLAEIFGYSQREIVQTLDFLDLVDREDRVLVSGNLRRQELGEANSLQYRFKGIRKDGTVIHVEVLNGKGSYEGQTAILGTLLDITARVKAEEAVEHMAYHDPLTGLPNRLLFADRVQQSLAYAERNKQAVAMLFLDLDRFKAVNDTLGHVAGDQLLKELARRLEECLRESDTIGRFGGDEFNILVTQMKQESDATLVAHKILRAMKFPFTIADQELFITCSIGIALYPRDSKDAHALLKNADTALYRAKDLGRNNYQVYSPAMNARALERMSLENSLRRVLERNELRVYYQPQVDLKTGRIIGVEALVRWQHSIGEMIQPSVFIPLAEEIGLIAPIGEWVLRTACHQARSWQKEGLPPLRVGVNVSARQLHDPEFAEVVTYIVGESDIDPQWVNLEITESVVVENAKDTISKFCQLQNIGITLAIDDFGIGYSSLSYLRDFPVNQLKMDRSFVKNLPHESNDANIARHIVAMAHEVGLTVIAEGVENREQFEFLRSLGCDEVQGFLVSAPLPAEDFTRLLHEGKTYAFPGDGLLPPPPPG